MYGLYPTDLCHGYLTLLSNRYPNTEIDIVPVPLRSITTRGQPLPYQNALQRVYMFSMALGRVPIQVKKHADPNRASQKPISAICPYP